MISEQAACVAAKEAEDGRVRAEVAQMEAARAEAEHVEKARVEVEKEVGKDLEVGEKGARRMERMPRAVQARSMGADAIGNFF